LEAFEKEADDLLEWSKQLDFDEYQREWAETAVSFGGAQYDSDEDERGKEEEETDGTHDLSFGRRTSTPFGYSDIWGGGSRQELESENSKKLAKFTESSEDLKLDMKSMET
jgi:hypothetical protein